MIRLRSLLSVALRLDRTGFVACSVLTAVLAFGTVASFPAVVGTTPDERRAATQQAERLAAQASLVLPVPQHIDTLPGFVQWRVFGGLPYVFAAWALLSGTAARGDEERGRLEQWLAAGAPRVWWAVARAVAFALLAAGAAAAAGAACMLGARLGGGTLHAPSVAAQCGALWGLTATCFGLAFVVAQLAGTRRSGLALGGALLGTLFLLNSVPRAAGTVPPARWLSPFYWYDRSDAVAPGGHLDLPGIYAFVCGSVLLPLLAGALFACRDVGGSWLGRQPASRPPVLVPGRGAWWRWFPAAALYEQRFVTLGCVVVAVALTWSLTVMAGPVASLLLESPATRSSERLLRTGDPTRVLLGYFLFGTLQLVIAGYALLHVSRWSADERTGRLAAWLSAPVARRDIVLGRALALTLGMVLTAAAGTAAGALGTRQHGVPLPAGDAVLAAAALLPFGLSFAAVGALLASLWPRAATVAMGACAAGSFLLLEFGVIFGWPNWLVGLSVFGLYGAPLASGVDWAGAGALSAVSLAGLTGAVLALNRRDIGR
jgi:ABC-2 type transport system permease protein